MLNTTLSDSFGLALHYVPLLAALMVFGLSIRFLMHPQRFFLRWFYRSWLMGIITLLIVLPFLFIFLRPEIGYLGMLLGYGSFFGGYRVFLAAQPELQDVPR